MTAPVHQGIVRALLGVCLIAVAGCGSSVHTVPVTGKVTFGGGPPPDCFVSFIPIAGESVVASGGDAAKAPPPRAGGAVCDAAGNFDASSLRGQRGLLPGRYEVRIIAVAGGSDPSSSEPTKNHVPAGFKPPELVVDADARTVRYDIDVPPARGK